MTIVDVSLLVIAAAAAATGIVSLIVVRRLGPLLHSLSTLTRDANQTIQRINRIADETEQVVRDARRLESRLSNTVTGFLDKVEPPLRTLGALAMAVRAGAGALRNARKGPG